MGIGKWCVEPWVLMWLDDVCGVGQKTTSSIHGINFDQVDLELTCIPTAYI